MISAQPEPRLDLWDDTQSDLRFFEEMEARRQARLGQKQEPPPLPSLDSV
jgi:hypothetical protein